jgi:hypothetical protein
MICYCMDNYMDCDMDYNMLLYGILLPLLVREWPHFAGEPRSRKHVLSTGHTSEQTLTGSGLSPTLACTVNQGLRDLFFKYMLIKYVLMKNICRSTIC